MNTEQEIDLSVIQSERDEDIKIKFDSTSSTAHTSLSQFTSDEMKSSTMSISTGKTQENFENEKKRKEDRFISIKKWEDKRVQLSSFFTKIVERLNTTLLKKGNDSVQSFGQIIQFFKNRIQADLKYSQVKNTQINNLHGKALPLKYDQFQNCLIEIDIAGKSIQNSHDKIAQVIEKDILQNLLVKNQLLYEQKLGEYSTLTGQLKSQYTSTYDLSLQKYHSYSEAFNDTIKIYGKQSWKQSDIKDLKLYELEYLSHVFTHYNTIKNFGKESITFYQDLKDMEKQRINLIKQSFIKYIKIIEDFLIIESTEDLKEILNELEQIKSEDEIKTSLNIEELIEPQEAHYIRKTYQVEDLTFEILLKFMNDFKYKGFGQSELDVKDIKALYNVQSGNNVEVWRECSVIITLDRNILIIEGNDSMSKTPLAKIKCQPKCYQIELSSSILTLYEYQSNFLCCKKCIVHKLKVNIQKDLEDFQKILEILV